MLAVSRWAQLVLVCGIASGCGGGSDTPSLMAVEGTVKYNGSPVANANVAFAPEKGPIAMGTTDAAGKFTLSTGGQAGATVGSGTITVVALETPAATIPAGGGADPTAKQEMYKKGMTGGAPKSLIPDRYAKVDMSGLTFTVKKGELNKFSVELKD